MIPTTLRRRVSLGGLAVLALIAIGASGSQAADPFVAGGRSTRPLTLGADQSAAARARVHGIFAALGVPAGRETVERLDDRFDHRTYDEVTSFDPAGHPVAIARLDPDGTLEMAVALGWHRAGAPAVNGQGAVARAAAFARAAGLVPHGQPEVRASSGAGGWSVLWPRVVNGVRVRGDGLRVLVFADGTFHGLARTERPLAAAPARALNRADAVAAARTVVAARSGPAAGDLRVAAAELAWIAPNATADGSALDAPDGTLRLAWVVRFEATGALVERLRTIEIWLDAGDGHRLGGSTIE
jgi:hypothetical protein